MILIDHDNHENLRSHSFTEYFVPGLAKIILQAMAWTDAAFVEADQGSGQRSGC